MNDNHDCELIHYGVKGMKWGIRKKREKSSDDRKIDSSLKVDKKDVHGSRYLELVYNKMLKIERKKLIADSKKITKKAPPGGYIDVYGRYSIKDMNGRWVTARHIVDDKGKVKMSFINGVYGYRWLAASKNDISKIDLNRFFKQVIPERIEYDVYD